MYKLLPLLLLASSAHAVEFNFTWDSVSSCDGPGICAPVTEYRVYEVFEDIRNLVGTSSTTSLTASYPVTAGLPVCFTAVAFNGLESAPSSVACVTPTLAAPSAPSFINVELSF